MTISNLQIFYLILMAELISVIIWWILMISVLKTKQEIMRDIKECFFLNLFFALIVLPANILNAICQTLNLSFSI
jgi:hypothetical protein